MKRMSRRRTWIGAAVATAVLAALALLRGRDSSPPSNVGRADLLDVVQARTESEDPVDLAPRPVGSSKPSTAADVRTSGVHEAVTVRVVSEARGDVVSGAGIYLATGAGLAATRWIGRTDAAGTCTAQWPAGPEPATLVVNHPRFAPTETRVAATEREVIVRLRDGGTIAGTVFDPMGVPAADALVVVRALRESRAPRGDVASRAGREIGRMRADARGDFRFEDLGDGRFILDVEHDDLRVDPPACTTADRTTRNAFPDAVVVTVGDDKVVLRTCYVAFYRMRVVDAESGSPINQPMMITVAHPDRATGMANDASRLHRLAGDDLDDAAISDPSNGIYSGGIAVRGRTAPEEVDLMVDAIGYDETVVRCPLLRSGKLRDRHPLCIVELGRSLPSRRLGRIIVRPTGLDAIRWHRRSMLILGGTLVGRGSDRASTFVASFDPSAPVGEGIGWPSGEWEFVVNGMPVSGGSVTARVEPDRTTTLSIPVHGEGCLLRVKSIDGELLADVRVGHQPLLRDSMGVVRTPSREDNWVVARVVAARGDEAGSAGGGVFVRVPVGLRRLSIGCAGFKPRQVDVEVEASEIATVDVTLDALDR